MKNSITYFLFIVKIQKLEMPITLNDIVGYTRAFDCQVDIITALARNEEKTPIGAVKEAGDGIYFCGFISVKDPQVTRIDRENCNYLGEIWQTSQGPRYRCKAMDFMWHVDLEREKREKSI